MAKLTNAADLFRDVLGQTRPKSPAILKTLTDATIFYSEYPGKDKAGHAQTQYLLDEDATERLKNVLEARKAPPPSKRPGEEPKSPIIIKAMKEAFKAKVAGLEDLILDQEGRLDELHKAIEAIAANYNAILKGMDPTERAKLPAEIVRIPTRYRWRVTVAGGPGKMVRSLEERFPMLRFTHVADSSQQHNQTIQRNTGLPNADLCLIMASDIGHKSEAKCLERYGKLCERVNGSLSSAEAALTVWLHQKEQAA